MAKFLTETDTNVDNTDLKSMKESGKALKDDARQIARSATAAAQEKVVRLKNSANEYIKSLTERVKRKPGQSMGIAFVAGALLSLLLRRR